MRKNIRQKLAKLFFTGLILSLTLNIFTVNAEYINAGTLDVKVADSESDYLTEYIKPGERTQRLIQISNFSAQTKNLKIYASKAELNKNANYFTKEGEAKGIRNWIDLPTKTLTLQPGESTILSTNLIVPKNASIGLHTGAILVREVNQASQTDQTFSLEKGIRVYLNVTGKVLKNGNLKSIYEAQSGNNFQFKFNLQNNGTVSFEKTYSAEIKDLFGNSIQKTKLNTKTEPGLTETSALEIPKPNFGIYNIYIGEETTNQYLKTILIVPLWMLAVLVFSVLLAAIYEKRTSICPIKLAISLHPGTLLHKFKKTIKSAETQRSISYFGIAALILTITLTQLNVDLNQIKTQLLLPSSKCPMNLTIKWGAFRNVIPPDSYTQQWKGRIIAPNSTISIQDYLHFENGDQAELSKQNETLYFNLETGPDNDGIIIQTQSLTEDYPTIYYQNDITGETYAFPIMDFVTSAGTYPQGLGGVYFKAEMCPEAKLLEKTTRLSAMKDYVATPELMATADIRATPPAGVQIPELENLFIEELPATPDVLSEFIFRSNYVDKISRIDSTRKIETDNILLRALQATPDILEEIAATPDLNFIFIPNDDISFPPLEFSFTEEKIIRQPMGTIIFVQNKKDNWNSFIGTSDFQLMSGDLRIPASALTIDPGEPILIGKYKVKDTNSVADANDNNNGNDKTPPGQDKEKTNNGKNNNDPTENTETNPEDEQNTDLIPPGQIKKIDARERKLEITEDDIARIKPGEIRTFTGRFDKATLVDVEPGNSDKLIFMLKPTLEIRIPAGMPAGTYQGELVITSL